MENNGRGIFYGVIGVATLVVAIIGATFAYFSAAGTGNEIETGGATVGLDFDDEKGNTIQPDLIPVNATNAAGFTTAVKGTCKDKYGYNICSVYEYEVGNPDTSSIDQTVYATIKPITVDNPFLEKFDDVELPKEEKDAGKTPSHNFTIAVFKGARSEIASYDVSQEVTEATTTEGAAVGTLLFKDTFHAGTDEVKIDALTETFEPGEHSSYTIVLWINEADHNQDYDQGKMFAGNIVYTTGSGAQLTGTFAG